MILTTAETSASLGPVNKCGGSPNRRLNRLIIPPSTRTMDPVTYPAWSLIKKTATLANSSGVPKRPAGMVARKPLQMLQGHALALCILGIYLVSRPVLMRPGSIMFTVIPSLATSPARDLQSPPLPTARCLKQRDWEWAERRRRTHRQNASPTAGRHAFDSSLSKSDDRHQKALHTSDQTSSDTHDFPMAADRLYC